MLSKLEMVYNDIDKANIKIYDYHISDTKKAACVRTNSIKAIAIDKSQIKTSAEERTIITEELSHYETNSLYLIEFTSNTHIGRLNQIICEAKARHHTIKKLLPFKEMKEAIHNGCTEIYELAEHFEVTEDFIKSAIKYYTENCNLDFN